MGRVASFFCRLAWLGHDRRHITYGVHMPSFLQSCSIVPFRCDANRFPVFSDEFEIMNKSVVAARNPLDRPAWHFKSLVVLSLFIFHQEITMANTKTTGSQAATSASKTLQGKSTGAGSKTASGSALSQTGAPQKQTSPSAATAASKVLRDGRTSAQTKSAGGSALAHAKGKE